MLNNIRNFSKTIFAKILLVIIIIPFVFWGMGGMFSGGQTNNIAKINNQNISTKDFVDHINKSNLNSEIIKENIDNNILEELLTELVSRSLVDIEIKDFTFVELFLNVAYAAKTDTVGGAALIHRLVILISELSFARTVFIWRKKIKIK